MKKYFFLLLSIIGFTSFVFSQKVDSIRTEQAGDFIKIRYKILNSSSDQAYKITVLCSMNGGLKTELRSISGDAGDYVIGGKQDYWVIWDVLKDMDELNSVEFFVRAELIKTEQIKNVDGKTEKALNPWAKRRFHVMLSGEVPAPIYGIRLAYMGSFGFSSRYTKGERIWESEDRGNETYSTAAYSMDLTKRLINKNWFQMHLMLGVEMAKLEVRDEIQQVYIDNSSSESPNSHYLMNCLGYESGLAFAIKRFAFSNTVTFFPNFQKGAEVKSATFVVGINLGIRF